MTAPGARRANSFGLSGRRTNKQIDADTLRLAAEIYRRYGVPASANVAEVVADAIENGTRKPIS